MLFCDVHAYWYAEVFQRLRGLKGRRTTKIFITHRFGHLTKHADFILFVNLLETWYRANHSQVLKEGGTGGIGDT